MPNTMLRNIPDRIYKWLQGEARRNHRSLNSEILAILSDEDSWAIRRLEIDSVMSELRPLRKRIRRKYPNAPDSVELLREIRNER
ncbi:MAG TPA: Arc family DNA-binding protein [Terriglobia bacterium]|nr:Arc family DNA-binding protein [Terriglobia bacterium]